jgi:hypothetical protein
VQKELVMVALLLVTKLQPPLEEVDSLEAAGGLDLKMRL